jgi:hypothetical protein
MVRKAILALALACPLFGLAQTVDLTAVTWEKVEDDNGIRIYQWNDKKSEVFAFKVEGIVAQPVTKVASVLIDIDRRKEWMENLHEAKIVRWVNKNERIEYNWIDTPFVIKDRDFVLDAKASFDKATRELTFSFHSIEDPEVPETGKVRGEVMDSSYVLKETPDKASTWLEHRMHIDPKGSVAKWIVNLFQRGFPKKTFEAIRKQAARDDVTLHEEVKKLYQ